MTNQESSNEPGFRRAPLLPLGLLTLVTLALEVFLTRLLAYTVHALLIYVVLGIAMLGFGAAGTLVALRRRWLTPAHIGHAMTGWALAFVVLLVVCYAIFVRMAPQFPDAVGWRTLLIASLLTLPFLASGVVVTLALSSAGPRIGKVYAADLVGSGIGCFLPLVLLGPLAAETFLALLAFLGWVAAVGFARASAPSRATRAGVVVALAASVLTGTFAARLFPLVPEPRGQVATIEKFSKAEGFRVEKVFDRWNVTGRVEVYEYHDVGEPGRYPYRFYAQDSTAGAVMAPWDGRDVRALAPDTPSPPPIVRMCNETFFGQAYFEPRLRVLVIGVGGGADVQCAVYHRAERVDAVEINPDAVAAIRGPFNAFLGGIGDDPRVRFHVRDGRSFAHAAEGERYDLVQLSGVDTKHFLASGGLPLSENHLYTVEAFVDYLSSLAPGGVLSLIRFGEGEAMRLISTSLSALERLGANEPERHLLAAQNGLAFGILVRGEPFPEPIVAAYKRHLWFDDRPWHGLDVVFLRPFDYMAHERPVLIYEPGNARPPMLRAFVQHFVNGDTEPFERIYPFNIRPATDDRPFFFDLTRYDLPFARGAPHVQALTQLVGSVVVLAILMILAPIARLRSRLRGGVRVLVPVYFVGVGLAYLLIEIWLLHRFSMFLGHQAYSLAAVLATLLVSTGLGALYGEKLIPHVGRRMRLGIAVALGLVVLGVVGLPAGLDALWRAPLALRVIATTLFIAPLGFVMGFPFPAGLAWLSEHSPASVPWCVGINFFASVLASSLAIPLSLLHGYTVVLLVGAAAYVVAGGASLAMRGRV